MDLQAINSVYVIYLICTLDLFGINLYQNVIIKMG